MFALLMSIVDVSLPIFKKSTFLAAVREGCRFGITYQTTYNGRVIRVKQPIKAVVQANSMGFLAGTAGAKLINVNYYVSTSSFTEVTAGGNGVTANADGNII
jgi:hypothetical protein